MKKIWHISDTHGYDKLLEIPDDIDILIHSGDGSNIKNPLLNENEFLQFWNRFEQIPIKYKIFVPGNHETFLDHPVSKTFRKTIIGSQYITDTYLLINDWIIIDNIKIWGSPVTPNYGNWAFMRNRSKTHKLWDTIPDDTDIIVTHGPPKSILDTTENRNHSIEMVGDNSLFKKVKEINPKYHLFGHVHNCKNIINAGIRQIPYLDTIFSNGSVVTDGKFGKLSSNGNILEI